MKEKIEIKDLLGVADPAVRLIEIVSDAIGCLYEPRKIKKMADAEAYKIKKITETAKEVNFNGEIQFLNNKIVINNEEVKSFEINTLITNEVRRLFNENENIKKIADYAYSELKNDCKKVSLEIDEDWKNNFFDKGKKIYMEDLQFIFGKILAGEIREPGTFSKRLLNILSSLSRKEAMLFNKVAKYIMKDSNNAFIVADREILDKLEIKLDDIILLGEVGLINATPLNISGPSLYEYKNHLINFFEQSPKLRIYCLTKSGYDLAKILNDEISMEYLLNIKQKYKIDKMSCSAILEKKKKGTKVSYSLDNKQDII